MPFPSVNVRLRLTKCQTKRPTGAFPAPKYGLMDFFLHSQAIREIQFVARFVVSVSFRMFLQTGPAILHLRIGFFPFF